MAHAQTLTDIQRNLYKGASSGHVTGIAALNGVIHGFVKRFRVSFSFQF